MKLLRADSYLSKSAPLEKSDSSTSLKGLGLGFLNKSSRSSSSKSLASVSKDDDGSNSDEKSVHNGNEERIDGAAKGVCQNACQPCSLQTEKEKSRKEASVCSNTNTTKTKPLKWLPRPELQSRYIYAAPGRLMMDGRVAGLDSIVAAGLGTKGKSDDYGEPEAPKDFAGKQPHLACEAGMSLSSLATTLVDKDGKEIERGKEDDRNSISSAIEEESEGWETETDRYGWEEEHMSMMSSRDSMSRRSVDSDAGSERTVRGGEMNVGSAGERGAMARGPPRDWKEQRERDNEGKKRGLLWRVLSMNAR